MAKRFNVLITSISKKVPLIQAVRQGLVLPDTEGKVFGGDSNPHCVGRHFVDKFWHMPLQHALTEKELIEYCLQHEIRAIIPTRDGELPFFARHRQTLLENGIHCMISSTETIELCRNKLLFYTSLSLAHLPAITTDPDIAKVAGGTYVVKECFGAGSDTIGLNLSLAQAKKWAERLQSPIFQPYIEGKEYSVDVYISNKGTPQGAIARTRDYIVHGESQITTSVHYPTLEELCLKAAKHLGIYGHAVFQALSDGSGHLHLIECNARFGGASTLSVAMGLHSFRWFFQECLKLPIEPFKRADREMKQIRYVEDLVVPV